MAAPSRPGAGDDNVPLAALLMFGGAAGFVVLAAMVKAAAAEATPMQAVLYRSVLTVLPLGAVLAWRRQSAWSPRWPLLALRGLTGFLALFCYFWAVQRIALADVIALQQLSPIFVAFLAVWLLGERPRPLHYLLAAVCLAGALLIARPTRGMASLPALVALASAVLSAAAYTSVRALTRSEPTARIVFWFGAVGLLGSLPFAVAHWRWPSLRASALLVGAGLIAAPAQSLMTAAYRRAPAHVAAAFSYANVPLAYLIGVLVWHDRPSLWPNLGIGLVVLGGVALVASLRAARQHPVE